MTRLRTSDLEALLAFLGDAQSVEGPVPFTTELLDRLGELVGCEYTSYIVLDKTRSMLPVECVLCSAEEAYDDEDEDGVDCSQPAPAAFGRHKRKLGFRRVGKLSDVFSARRRRHPSGSWNYCEPWYTVDEMWIYLRPSWIDVVAVTFSSRRDLGERERTIAELLRPQFAARHRTARIQRRLDAALAALERDDGDGVVLLERDTIEFASPSAQRLLHTYFGATSKIPERVLQWYDNGRAQPLTVSQNGSQLVVTSANGGSALMLHEQPTFVSALTPRERDVMRCVGAGLANAEIAQKLSVEPSTVRKHLENIYEKLGVRSRTAALAKLNAVALSHG